MDNKQIEALTQSLSRDGILVRVIDGSLWLSDKCVLIGNCDLVYQILYRYLVLVEYNRLMPDLDRCDTYRISKSGSGHCIVDVLPDLVERVTVSDVELVQLDDTKCSYYSCNVSVSVFKYEDRVVSIDTKYADLVRYAYYAYQESPDSPVALYNEQMELIGAVGPVRYIGCQDMATRAISYKGEAKV